MVPPMVASMTYRAVEGEGESTNHLGCGGGMYVCCRWGVAWPLANAAKVDM
jgi:hypothetical protein